MSILLITPSPFFHNSKISFSREELNDILGCYALGVSKGNWRENLEVIFGTKSLMRIFIPSFRKLPSDGVTWGFEDEIN